MSVNQTMPKEMNSSTSELRLSEIEARLKKHEELLKTVENLSKRLNEKVNKTINKAQRFHLITIVHENLINNKKRNGMKELRRSQINLFRSRTSSEASLA